jgi:hypothetical protein
MSSLPGRKRALHRYDRQGHDWYCEPGYTVRSLFDRVRFTGPIHDPCCGRGMIPTIAAEYGHQASGSDLVHRGQGVGGIDFLTDNTQRQTLIFNPPFKIAAAFVLHALDVAPEVAVLVKVQFLNSQSRYDQLYSRRPPSFVLVLSRRPSMPPGDVNQKPRNGTDEFTWLVWGTTALGVTTLDWADPNPRGIDDRAGRLPACPWRKRA